MTNSRQIILAAALDSADRMAIRPRIKLYRALVDFVGGSPEAMDFERLANDLEAAEARHQELALQFAEAKAGKGTFHFHCGEFVDQAAAAKARKGPQ